MNRAQAIAELLRHADAVRGMGATGLYLFGSTARDQALPDSDMDLFIDHAPDGTFSLIDLAGIKQLLEEQVASDIDITTRNSLHPLLKADIEKTAVRIF